jgi:imidazole glycerol-phosphate synthase subunit HisH
MVAILDYGIGNINSIFNMLKKIGAQAVITSDPERIQQADKLILPGVGHFDYCMQQLRKAPFYQLMQDKVLKEKVPVLGVCVGCQMLMESSEEGSEIGIGWIKGKVIRFKTADMDPPLKVPHMAWTDVHVKNNNKLYTDIAEPRFYFVHSYHLSCDDQSVVSATAGYGYEFTASVQQENITGVQFHPEKSHKFGMKLYDNFVNLY